MKLNGKEAKEYENVESLAEATKAELDGLAFRLQKFALMTQENQRLPSEVILGTVSAYLNAVTQINTAYDTKYSAKIQEIKDHFSKPALQKD